MFRDLDLPGAEDPKLQAGIGALYKSSDEGGRNGIELDDQTRNRMQMELDDQFNSASDLQIRSFMFGGTITIVGEDGKLSRVKPAYKYLIDKGIQPGDGRAPDGSPEHNQYLKFQAALESLKESDFSKRGGGDMRESLIKMVSDSAEEYHQNGYDIYMDKQALAEEKQNNSGKQESGYVKTKKFDQYILESEWNDYWQPTIDALNSEEENIAEFTGAKGTPLLKKNGVWFTSDGSGAMVETTREYVARRLQLTNELTEMDTEELILTDEEKQQKADFANANERKTLGEDGTAEFELDGETYTVTKDTYTIVDGVVMDKEGFKIMMQNKRWSAKYANQAANTATKIQNQIRDNVK